MERFFAVWLTFLGLCVGSFLNVVIARLPNDESIVRPRSKCPKCGKPIAWYDNIPVVSWLVLRAKCRNCGQRISARYPAVELVTGALFLAAYARVGFSYELVPALAMLTLLIPITLIDAEHWIIPHELSWTGIVLGVLAAIPLGLEHVRDAVLGVVVAFMAFRALEFFGWLAFRKEALGAGDKFLFALIGGFLSFKVLLGVILFASVQGSAVGIARILVTGRAGPAPEGQGDEKEEELPEPTMTWEFTRPGLSLGRRLLAIPYAIFLQPIPDDPVDEEGEEADWVPGKTNLPFGPWLAAGAVEVFFFGHYLTTHFAPAGVDWFFGP